VFVWSWLKKETNENDQVEAIDGIINGRSIQIAWNLSPEQELHVTFVGLRAPNGEVGCFFFFFSFLFFFEMCFVRKFLLKRVTKFRGLIFRFGRKSFSLV
jgi:hypothetical protein